MAAKLIDGKALSEQLRAEVGQRAAALAAQGHKPGLAVILVGDDPASAVYVRNKVKACADHGLHSVLEQYPATMSQPELLARGLRVASTHVMCVISGRSRVKAAAWPANSSLSMSRATSSRAMRISASWFWIRRRPICCCVISVSRFTDSVSRSISSLRRYQKAEMIAARNSSTDSSGPSVA